MSDKFQAFTIIIYIQNTAIHHITTVEVGESSMASVIILGVTVEVGGSMASCIYL